MKQGYVYTIGALFFLGIFIAVFLAGDSLHPSSQTHTRHAHIMNDFLEDVHSDLNRAAFISGFRALIALEEYVAQTGTYLSNVSGAFEEVFVNGTFNGNSFTVIENATFSDYVTRVHSQAQELSYTLNISLVNATLYHISAWDVAVDYTVHITLSDFPSTTKWNYTKQLSSVISVVDLRDPLYSVETNNKLLNTIKQYDGFVEFVDDAANANDTTVLAEFLDKSYYSASPLAPSFLMRFAGNWSASEFGIESLVDLEALDAQGIVIDSSESVVDYLYFSNTNSADICTVQNMPAYFALDNAHINMYEIDGELEYGSC